MQGVKFSFDTNRENVTITISPGELEQELSAEEVHKAPNQQDQSN